jgi:hypothetical protein
MQGVLECQGQIRFGSLPWEISERLAQFHGNWLEFLPDANAIIFRRVQSIGCPALTGVPCELITLIDSLPPEYRESMPGGELSLKDQKNQILRLLVKQGEVHIKWPQESCFQTVPVSFESAIKEADPNRIRVRGWARFAGSSARGGELQAFVDRFGGLYPEEDMPSECEQNMVYVRFKDAHLEPQELVAKLQDLADPLDSLQADLEIGSFGQGSVDQDLRIQIVDGRVETTRPLLQP